MSICQEYSVDDQKKKKTPNKKQNAKQPSPVKRAFLKSPTNLIKEFSKC